MTQDVPDLEEAMRVGLRVISALPEWLRPSEETLRRELAYEWLRRQAPEE